MHSTLRATLLHGPGRLAFVPAVLVVTGCSQPTSTDRQSSAGSEAVGHVSLQSTVGGCDCPSSGGCSSLSYTDIPGSNKYLVTTFGGGSDTQTMSCGGMADGSWAYIADVARFGCGAKVRMEANGKACVAQVADCGPNRCVEEAACDCGCGGHTPIIDSSPYITNYLYGISSAGYSDGIWVTATQVASNTPIGCSAACTPAAEVCNGVDDDCDGVADNHNACGSGPNGCETHAGAFAFNCAGALSGMYCTNANESSDPDSWGDNYFCSQTHLGMAWSTTGAISGMDCVQVGEGAEPASHAWTDNFLCLLPGAPYTLTWSSAGPGSGDCVRWEEPSDPDTWWDNFMCAQKKEPHGCVWRVGGFAFSCAGPIDGMTCVSVNEPSDSDSWGDNYFCSDYDIGMKWSVNGSIDGMSCVQVAESAEPAAHGWGDNFLCLPKGAPYQMSWSSAGPISGKTCIGWDEVSDPDSWSDNFLCQRPTDAAACVWRDNGFGFSCSGPIDGMHCVNVNEPSDSNSWNDNHFCSDLDLGMQWSASGPIPGFDCVGITEPGEPQAEGWTDNYLCLPHGAPVALAWSFTGAHLPGTCIRWYEGSDVAQGWGDNFLCVVDKEPSEGADASVDGSGAAGYSGSAADASGTSDGNTGWTDGGDAGRGLADAGSGWAGSDSSDGCACRTSERGRLRWSPWSVLLAALAALRLRRCVAVAPSASARRPTERPTLT